MEKITVTIDLKEKITSGIKKIVTGFAKAADSAHDFKRILTKTASELDKFEGISEQLNFPNFNALQLIAERVCDGFVAASESGIVFEQSIADLQSITGIAGKDLELLRDNCRRLGVESGLGAAEAARSYSLLASQIEISKIGMDGLNTLQERAITLAQASGMSMEASANALAGTINQFGLSAEEAVSGKWKEKFVKSYSEQITADGCVITDGSADKPSYDILREKMLAGEPVTAHYSVREDSTREGKTAGGYTGQYIITSLELDGQAGDDAKYSVTLENSGAVTKVEGGTGLTEATTSTTE